MNVENNNAALNVVFEELKCDGSDACEGIEFNFTGAGATNVGVDQCELKEGSISAIPDVCLVDLEELECTAELCQFQTYTIVNPQEDFELKCDDPNSCAMLDLTITISATSDISSIKGFKCGDTDACNMATITIVNNQADTLIIEEVDCSGNDACDGLEITSTGSVGAVILNEFKCDDIDKCNEGCTVFGAPCTDFIDNAESFMRQAIDIRIDNMEKDHTTDTVDIRTNHSESELDNDSYDYLITIGLNGMTLIQLWSMFGVIIICNCCMRGMKYQFLREDT